MLDSEREAIEARLAAVTGTPWWYCEEHGAVYCEAEPHENVADVGNAGDTSGVAMDLNGDFIAHAPGDMAELLAEGDALRARLVVTPEKADAVADIIRGGVYQWDAYPDCWVLVAKAVLRGLGMVEGK